MSAGAGAESRRCLRVVQLAWRLPAQSRAAILGYNALTLQPSAVFNSTPNGSDGTMWARARVSPLIPKGTCIS